MRIKGTTVRGVLRKRLTRFLASVHIHRQPTLCFVPNPGRLAELLVPGRRVLLKVARGKGRKTDYDLIGVYQGRQLISIDPRVPNALVLEGFKQGSFQQFSSYQDVKPESRYARSRFDFLLTDGSHRCWLGVKSCTLVRDRAALFPDALTDRGRRHLEELMEAKREGYRAIVLFLIQRDEAKSFSPNDSTDTAFARVLRSAAEAGVEVYAYSSKFADGEIRLQDSISVELVPGKLSGAVNPGGSSDD